MGNRNFTSVNKWIVSVTLVNSLLFISLGFRYLNYIELTSSILQYLYLGITTVGHMGSIPLIGLFILFGVSRISKNRSLLLAVSVLLFSLGLLFITVDSFIYSQYRFNLNRFVLGMLFGGAAKDIFQFSFLMYFMAGLFVLVLLVMEIAIGRFLWRYQIIKLVNEKYVIICLLVVMLFSHLSHAYATANGYTPVTKVARTYPLYFPLTANGMLEKLGLVNLEALERNKAPKEAKSSNVLNYPQHKLQFKGGKKPNILIIAIDCWRGDYFDSLITPNIYQFSKSCSVFKNHYSGSCATRGGIFSIFYGIPSFAYWHTMKTAYQRPIFMEKLAQEKYDFKIYGSAKLTYPAFHRTVFAGIENLRLKTECENEAPYAKDAKMNEEWLVDMEKRNKKADSQPFFGFLFYDAAHGNSHPNPKEAPFQPSWEDVNYLALNNDLDPKPFINLFKNSLNYIDKKVGVVLNKLKVSGELDNTIVIITGDHGQEFNDNKKNYWGHGSNFSKAQLHVPLIVFWPNKKANTYTHKTFHYDIVPTLVKTELGCTNPISDYSIGKILWDKCKTSWYVAGSDQRYAVIEDKQITTVLYGNYSVTKHNMQDLDDSKLNSSLMFEAMKENYRYYAPN